MKSLKSLTAFGLLALSASASFAANLPNAIYIVGAPAYRQDSIASINALVVAAGGGETASTSSTSNFSSANQVQWLIPSYNGNTNVEINASFTGSTAGLESVSGGATANITQKFIPDGTGTIATPVIGASSTEAHLPDFTLSDTFQATTPFNGTVRLQGPTLGAFFTNTYAPLTRVPLGIEPYKFVGSAGLAAAGVTNITTSQAQLLFKNGALPLSFFTGNNGDEGKLVYGLTRDGGSGARLVAVAETGIGVSSHVLTYKPTIVAGTGTVDSNGNFINGTITDDPANVPPYPHGVIPSTGVYDTNDGDTGYASFGGSGLTGLLAAITSNFGSPGPGHPGDAYFITYFNVPDGSEAILHGAEELTYNGIPFSQTNVAEGKYTFWSYESLFKGSLTAGSNAAVFANSLASNFLSTTPISGVNVLRTIDGGPVAPNF